MLVLVGGRNLQEEDMVVRGQIDLLIDRLPSR